MSRGDGRALEAAARAIYGKWQGRELPTWTDDYLPNNETRENAEEIAQIAYDAIFDALVSELPDHAVRAVRDYYGSTPRAAVTLDDALRAFLLSLRSSSRGASGRG